MGSDPIRPAAPGSIDVGCVAQVDVGPRQTSGGPTGAQWAIDPGSRPATP